MGKLILDNDSFDNYMISTGVIMCRLFGFRSNVESRAHHSLIVAENAMANQASHHSDGWGIGYFIDEDSYLFRTSKGAAQDDS